MKSVQWRLGIDSGACTYFMALFQFTINWRTNLRMFIMIVVVVVVVQQIVFVVVVFLCIFMAFAGPRA